MVNAVFAFNALSRDSLVESPRIPRRNRYRAIPNTSSVAPRIDVTYQICKRGAGHIARRQYRTSTCTGTGTRAAPRWPDRVLDDHARRITHNRQRRRPSRESIVGRTWHTPAQWTNGTRRRAFTFVCAFDSFELPDRDGAPLPVMTRFQGEISPLGTRNSCSVSGLRSVLPPTYMNPPSSQKLTRRSLGLRRQLCCGQVEGSSRPDAVIARRSRGASSTYMNARFGQNLTGLISWCGRRPVGDSRSDVRPSGEPARR